MNERPPDELLRRWWTQGPVTPEEEEAVKRWVDAKLTDAFAKAVGSSRAATGGE